jgi:hypothetical protein
MRKKQEHAAVSTEDKVEVKRQGCHTSIGRDEEVYRFLWTMPSNR